MSELRDAIARAMRAQGKVNPDEVFAEAEAVDIDDDEPPAAFPDVDRDPGGEPPPLDPTQETLLEEDRGYTYEP